MLKKRLLSIVIPVHNEEACIRGFLEDELLPVVKKIDEYDIQLVLVNDGSRDDTLYILKKFAKQRGDKVRLLSLSRNFGKEAALAAGMRYADGDAILTMDADGQQPPKLIPKFIKKWEGGAKVVTGVRDKFTKHGLLQRVGSKLFYKLLRMMGNKYTVPGSTDYRIIDREVVDEYNKLSEHNRITRGLVDWLGYKQEYIEYTYGARMAGKPSYNLKKLFHLAVDSFISMSTTPLVVFGYIGIFITMISFMLGVFVIVNQYILGDPLQLYWNGAVQMSIFISFLVGLVLISQAITALYISHIHAETQGRPLYVIDRKESCNLGEQTNDVYEGSKKVS
ncbi:glycosyltransferase family 2 protein [Candidatus Saccharibacteria bacterium]|nr:glycosyltransferase family 2 protein [Candidatus Saccharibacteria bacterium]